MITVKGPDGTTYNFPDAATPEQIEGAMKENYPSSSAPASTSEKIQNMPGLQGSLARGGQYALNRLADVEQGAAAAIPKAAQFVTEGVSQGFGSKGKDLWAKAANVMPWLPKPDQDYMQAAAPIGSGEQGFVPEMAREAGGYLGYGAFGEAAALPQAGGKIASALGKSILGEMLAGGAYGASNNNDNRIGGAAEGALTNVAGAGLAQGIAKGLEKLRPSKLFRGNLNADQLRQNVLDAQGTDTALGNVIGNAGLQRLSENVLSNTPFSGARQAAERSAQATQDKAGGFMADVLGNNSPKDVGGQLQRALIDAEKGVRAEKNAKFNELNEAGDKYALPVDSIEASNVAKGYQEQLKNPKLAALIPQDIKDTLALYSDPNSLQSFKETGILRGKLGESAREYSKLGKDYEAGIYSSLKAGLDKDWNKAIDMSGKPELKTMRDNANQFYKENFAPFKEPEVAKFIRKGGDADTLIGSFVKTGNGQDRGRLLEKLTSKLPDDKRGLVPFGYFSKSMKNGEINPVKFATDFEKLGESQKKVLFPTDKSLQQAETVANLGKKNQAGFYNMHNPPTGQKLLDLGTTTGLSMAGAFMGGPVGAVLTPAIGIALGRMANKKLTSEPFREEFVKNMLSGEKKFKPKPVRNQTLAQALMNRQSEDQQNG